MSELNPPGKPFLGFRFVLSGFDIRNEEKVRSKLVEGGGIEAEQYSENCTHVIVDKIVYDDPLCVTARKDCKTLVTGLWVDHSFDIGMPVDAASVMYRPLKDLNGIPGAKGLIMCLTGYQRQDRDDIMTMVSLMGAQFSKPLVANKVTHLICYKFEGEKYELAKKLPKIKLVNHRWLEDCLRDWEILPEENYNKSGYEMEMMEAEAKDSEEEAEDVSVKHYAEENMHNSPNLKSGYPKERKSSELVAETSNIQSESTLSKDPLNVDHSKGKLLVHNISNKSDQVSSFDNVPFYKTFDYHDSGLQEPTYSEPPDPHFRTPISKNATNDLTSSSLSAERPPHTDGKINAASYSRKMVRRLGELSRDGLVFDKESIGKLKPDELSSSFIKEKHSEDRTGSDCVEALQKGIDLQFGERSTGFSPPKQLSTGSFASHNLLKINDAKPCIRKSPSASPGELPHFKMMASESGLKDIVFEKTSPSPFKRLKMPSLSSGPHFSDFDVGSSTPVAADIQECQNHQQDVMGSAACNRDPGTNSNDPSSSNLVGNDNSVTKPLRKKMVVKKTLGSRPKFTDKKGSICMDKKRAPQNDAAICLSGSNDNSSNTMKSQLFSTIVKNESPRKAETKGTNNENAVHRIESLDDETETLEEKFQQVLKNVTPTKEQNATPIQLIGKSNNLSEKKSTGVQQLSKDTSPGTHAVALKEHKEQNASENTSNISAPAEPSSKAGRLKRKKQKGNTDAVGKSKTKPDDAEEVVKSKEDNAIPIQLIGKANILSEKKSTGAQHLSNDTSASTQAVAREEGKEGNASENAVGSNISALAEPSSEGGGLKSKKQKGKKGAVGKSKAKKPDDVKEVMKSKEHETIENNVVKEIEKERAVTSQSKNRNVPKKGLEKLVEEEKENKPIDCGTENISEAKRPVKKQVVKDIRSQNFEQSSAKSGPNSSRPAGVLNKDMTEPAWFILSGHRLQRKEFQKVIRRLKGRLCRDSHQWSYQATHFIAPDPIRRTEKFFAAAASGRWILKTDYLAASNEAGKLVEEEPYEWYKTGLSEDGAINLEAPRKWRLLRERTGHGAFHGMHIVIYGECIAPPLDTLKRVVKAGDGTILATSPPYTRFLGSSIDFAVVTPGMPRVDAWVQEFLKHEIPCVVADYLVEYVCKPGYSLEKHVLYNSHEWAKKSFAKLQARAEEVVMDLTTPDDFNSNDVPCKVCGRRDRGESMLICGDESGSSGCGVGCHIDCCDPPFEDIPEDDWFCSECSDRRSKGSEKSSNKRKKGDSSLKCK